MELFKADFLFTYTLYVFKFFKCCMFYKAFNVIHWDVLTYLSTFLILGDIVCVTCACLCSVSVEPILDLKTQNRDVVFWQAMCGHTNGSVGLRKHTHKLKQQFSLDQGDTENSVTIYLSSFPLLLAFDFKQISSFLFKSVFFSFKIFTYWM